MSKFKPLPHQSPYQNSGKGRPRTTMKPFTREGVYALKVRIPLKSGEAALSPWRWYGADTKLTETWWKRALMPSSAVKGIAADYKLLGGAKVKVVTVWRKTC